MQLPKHEPERLDPMVLTMGYLSLMLGIASCLGYYTLAAGPAAIILGLWARSKGFKKLPPLVGIIMGCVGLSILALILYARLNQMK